MHELLHPFVFGVRRVPVHVFGCGSKLVPMQASSSLGLMQLKTDVLFFHIFFIFVDVPKVG